MISRRALLLSAASSAIASPAILAATPDARRNAALVRRYFDEVWNAGRLDVLDEILAPSYINHTPSTPDPPRGPGGLKPIVAAIRSAFPDLHFSIEDIIATDQAAVARVLMTGTQRGSLFGIAPTGRKIAVNQINIEHVRDGRIVEHWRVTDELALQRQLGVIP